MRVSPSPETFDQASPAIQNLHVYDANGDITDGYKVQHQDPIPKVEPGGRRVRISS